DLVITYDRYRTRFKKPKTQHQLNHRHRHRLKQKYSQPSQDVVIEEASTPRASHGKESHQSII
ncbi:MAG: hypothetical protein ACI9FD_004745, partial [Gammaproteobacteria bacterium]